MSSVQHGNTMNSQAEVDALGLWPGRSDLQEILPRVFLTNFFGARNKRTLDKAGITHLLVCATELPFVFAKDESRQEQREASHGSFVYSRLPLSDNPGVDLGNFERGPLACGISFIEDALCAGAGNRVLLHCAAGGSRSAAVLIGYVMWLEKHRGAQRLLDKNGGGESLYDVALEFVRKKRPIVAPNVGFEEQLRSLEFIMDREGRGSPKAAE